MTAGGAAPVIMEDASGVLPQAPAGAPRKSGEMTPELTAEYAEIAAPANRELQRAEFDAYLKKLGAEKVKEYENLAAAHGFALDAKTGRIRYAPSFKPVAVNFDVCYVRHGKTEGNTEPRIYQGCVDYWENQLTAVGLEQAEQAAERMEKFCAEKNWNPDAIVLSPLLRAQRTGAPFARKRPEVPVYVLPDFGEMRFGDWDNRRVIDIGRANMGHLFYLEQNALVRAPNAHVVGPGFAATAEGTEIAAECFLDVVDRQARALRDLDRMLGANGARKKVIIYGHSMAGAALSMLLGHGRGENGELGFDGKYIMPNATPTLLGAKQP